MGAEPDIERLGRACDLYEQDPVRGFAEFRALAEIGSRRSMEHVGQALATGRGVNADLREAFHWFERAAEAGSGYGMYQIGLAFELGKGGVKADVSQAVRWYRRAAEAGSANGMFQLGVAFQFGKVGDADLPEAIRWYERARQCGYKTASIYLGALLSKLKRYDEAERVLCEGALKNDPPSMYWLAKAYLSRGQKLEEARELLEKAAASGYLYAQGGLARSLMAGRFGRRRIIRGALLWVQGAVLVLWECRRGRPLENPRLRWW